MLIPDCVHLKGITGILHCGAHLAEEAELYASAGHDKVLWVEGNDDLIYQLVENLAKYPGQTMQHAMLWESCGEVDFHVTSNSQSSSIFPLGTHAVRYPGITVERTQKYVTNTLDWLLGDGRRHLNFWNLDLQGVELQVLRGAGDALGYCDYLYTEVNFEEVHKGCALVQELDLFLEDFVRLGTADTGMGWGDAIYVRKNK